LALFDLCTFVFRDIAPENQVSRAISIFAIPFGLVIIGLLLSYSFASKNGKTLVIKPDVAAEANKVSEFNEILEKIKKKSEAMDVNEDGKLSKAEMIAASTQLNLTAEEASELFDKLDEKKQGYLERKVLKQPFFQTISGQCFILLVRLYIPILIGALFFKLFPPEAKEESDLTWIDAVYFATVTSTSVGFGDITPQTDWGRGFLIFYMLWSTVVVGGVLGDFIELYIADVVGEGIFADIIDSTTVSSLKISAYFSCAVKPPELTLLLRRCN